MINKNITAQEVIDEIILEESDYWKVRDYIVNNIDTDNTMCLVIDLLGNLINLEEENREQGLDDLYNKFWKDLEGLFK
jgi:hypothetical protein